MKALNKFNQGAYQSPSLREILSILSIEYGEDLTYLSQFPHRWLIVQDYTTGLMGGMCLTPSIALQSNSMLAAACNHLNSEKIWLGSHFFCWISNNFEERNIERVKPYVEALYKLIYEKYVEICKDLGITHSWLILRDEQYQSLKESTRFPFEAEMTANFQGDNCVVTLLPALSADQRVLRWTPRANSNSQHMMN